MTTPLGATRKYHSGDGARTAFPFPFLLRAASEITVYVNGSVVSVGQYTVSGLGLTGGGEVVFSSPPGGGAKVCLVRRKAVVRTEDRRRHEPTFASRFNEELDRLYEHVQDLSDRLDIALQVPAALADGFSGTLQAASLTAGRSVVVGQTGFSLSSAAIDDLASTVSTLQAQVGSLGPSTITAINITLVNAQQGYLLPAQAAPNGAGVIVSIGPIRLVAGVHYTIGADPTHGAGRQIVLSDSVTTAGGTNEWPAGQTISGCMLASVGDAAIGLKTIIGAMLDDEALNDTRLFGTAVVPAAALVDEIDLGAKLAEDTIPVATLVGTGVGRGALMARGASGWGALTPDAPSAGLALTSNGVADPTWQGPVRAIGATPNFGSSNAGEWAWHGISPNVRALRILLRNLRMNGAEQLLLQLGTGTADTPVWKETGYTGCSSVPGNSVNRLQSAFIVDAGGNSSAIFSGTLMLEKLNGDTSFVLTGLTGRDNAGFSFGMIIAASVDPGAALTQIRLKTAVSSQLVAGLVSVTALY
ncbi:MAG: hypothetical protein IPK75_18905 [Acidobacteria bacterium]|nr:hypothetical protein [Acidobacteriota bacterium]